SNERFASDKTASIHTSKLVSVSASFIAFFAVSFATVKMVPSTGLDTEAYATVTPLSNACAKVFVSKSFASSKPSAKPRNNCDKITPELPLAPINKPREKVDKTSWKDG